MSKICLLAGITGQVGSFLAEFLLDKGYEIYGLERHISSKNRGNVLAIENDIKWLQGDLTDQNSLLRALKISKPDEVYNLAAQSFVGESFKTPENTSNVTGLGVLRMLEAIREYSNPVKFYQAGSSEMFGKTIENPSNENTPFYPRSPYGVSKVYAHFMTKNYRESYNMFNCNGILFNHESERRGYQFVTRKISDGVAKIKLGIETHITLGNLDAKRDWGYAKDYVEAMYLMLQQDEPDDYVIATGETHSIKDFLKEAFNCVGIENWQEYVKQDQKYMRPAEVDYLCGDYSYAKKKLNWKPKTKFKDLVNLMVERDMELWQKKIKLSALSA